MAASKHSASNCHLQTKIQASFYIARMEYLYRPVVEEYLRWNSKSETLCKNVNVNGSPK